MPDKESEPYVGVIDYGMGNIGSILNMLRRLGIRCLATRDPRELESCDRMILPGVGAFDAAMKQLESVGLIAPLNDLVVQQKRLVLGICLGMQLMTECSEEGNLPGFGWVEARTTRFQFPDQSRLKVPNMGWRQVTVQNTSQVFASALDHRRFYFVHSYYVNCYKQEQVAATAEHGQSFVAAFSAGNVHGVQFHPEKSHRFGMQLLKDYASIPC